MHFELFSDTKRLMIMWLRLRRNFLIICARKCLQVFLRESDLTPKIGLHIKIHVTRLIVLINWKSIPNKNQNFNFVRKIAGKNTAYNER